MKIEECLEVQAIRVKRAFCECGGELRSTGVFGPQTPEGVSVEHRCSGCSTICQILGAFYPNRVPETIKLPVSNAPFQWDASAEPQPFEG